MKTTTTTTTYIHIQRESGNGKKNTRKKRHLKKKHVWLSGRLYGQLIHFVEYGKIAIFPLLWSPSLQSYSLNHLGLTNNHNSLFWGWCAARLFLSFFSSRAYAFGREMVCSQKSVRNRNFFENAGHVSFSFCQTGSAETHTKPCKTSPQGTSIKRIAI